MLRRSERENKGRPPQRLGLPMAAKSERTLRLERELASARLLHQRLLAEEQVQRLEVTLRDSLEEDAGFDPLVVQDTDLGECEWQESGVPRVDTFTVTGVPSTHQHSTPAYAGETKKFVPRKEDEESAEDYLRSFQCVSKTRTSTPEQVESNVSSVRGERERADEISIDSKKSEEYFFKVDQTEELASSTSTHLQTGLEIENVVQTRKHDDSSFPKMRCSLSPCTHQTSRHEKHETMTHDTHAHVHESLARASEPARAAEHDHDEESARAAEESPRPRPSGGDAAADSISKLAEALMSALSANAAQPQLKRSADDGDLKRFVARQAVESRELPTFSGLPEEWPIFEEHFQTSTRECQFSDAENMARLRKALKGRARESVSAFVGPTGERR